METESSRQNGVIPAEAGIQRIEDLPRKRNSIMVLSASRGVFSYWIPAFAGMTGQWVIWDQGQAVMETESSSGFVVAEMNTHAFMFRGAGRTRNAARTALLNAWRVHRTALLARYPERTDSIPDETRMEDHFKIVYLEFEMDAGYRDGERLV